MKYCPNCGTQLDDDAAFCQACGKRTSAMSAQAPPMAPAEGPDPAPKPPKKRRLWLVIGIPVAVLLIAAAVVLALTVQTPMVRFGKGLQTMAASLRDVPKSELDTRMTKEPFDLTASMDLADLSEQIPQLTSGKLKIGVKAGQTEGGLYLAVDQGDAGALRFCALITGDKLYVGGANPYADTAAYVLTLNCKADATLQEKLMSLASERAQNNQPMMDLAKKLSQYAVESLDKDWFTNERAQLRDELTGTVVKTRAAVLTLDAGRLKTFLDTLLHKLDSDPDFFNDLDREIAALAPGQEHIDSRTAFRQGFDELSASLKDMGDAKIRVLVHYRSFSPVALEITTDIKGAPQRFLAEKSAGRDTASYLLMMEGNGSDIPTLTLRATLTQQGGTYTRSFSVQGATSGEQASAELKAVTDTQKDASSLYHTTTRITADWKSSGSGDTSGNIGVTLKGTVGFGSEVKPVQSDEDYLYKELSAAAKPVGSLSELGNELGVAGY